MSDYETRSIAWMVGPRGEPVFSEAVTVIEMEDHAEGEFVTVTQSTDTAKSGTVQFDFDEWPAIRAAIDAAIESANKKGTGDEPASD